MTIIACWTGNNFFRNEVPFRKSYSISTMPRTEKLLVNLKM